MSEIWKIPPLPEADRDLILRYARGKRNAEIDRLLDDVIRQGTTAVNPKLCFAVLPVKLQGDIVIFDTVSVRSRGLAAFLSGCSSAVLFAATVGADADRMILRAEATSPARALLLDAFFTERVETLCDLFCARYKKSSNRFSPGYDDLPLSFQKTVFSLLDCPRKIGLTLGENLLMMPTKSVTAFIGIQEESI